VPVLALPRFRPRSPAWPFADISVLDVNLQLWMLLVIITGKQGAGGTLIVKAWPSKKKFPKGAIMRTKPCLSATDVKKILEACEAEALKNSWNVAVAIVDEGAHLLGFQRMDGAGPISAEVAIGKARTSALTKRPSKFFEDRVKDRPAFTSFPAGVLIQGALPIMHQNECVGAIGVSGVQSHEDERIAQAGLNVLG
jgi:glc operon protein GlcG